MQLFEARVGVVKTQALVRCHKDALGTIVATLGHLATQHDQGLGWATYATDPATLGGRFNAGLEVYCDVAAADRVRSAIAESLLQTSPLGESRIQILREVLALP